LAVKLETGDELEVAADGPGRIRIRKAKLKPTLEPLVLRITAESPHAETDWSVLAGKELC